MEPSEPFPDVPGWEVRRELGRGGNSTVWLVAAADGTEAALKVPRHGVDAPAELLDVELLAVGELAHDHVVRPLGVVSTDRGPGLLSEYHAGGSLGSLVRAAGPLPIGQVVTILVPVAQALQALHEHGVVHGDLSPGNILFTVQGRPAVSDLGSSRLLGGPRYRAGTAGFCAPEGDGGSDGPGTDGVETAVVGLDPAADVYSLAAVGWFALTGRAPARTSSRAPLPLIVPDIPLEVVELLEAGLEEDPTRRPTADRFAMACYRWTTPEPVDLYPSASPEVAMELPTRRRDTPVEGRRRRRRGSGTRGYGALPGMPGTGRRFWMVAGSVGVLFATVAGWGLFQSVAGPAGPQPSSGSGLSSQMTTPTEAALPPPQSSRTSSSPSTEPTPSSGLGMEDVSAAAEALGPAREKALTTLDRRQVEVYSLADSPALAADLALLEDLASQDLRYEGLQLDTRVVGAVEHADASSATVPLELTISPYRTVSQGGETVAETTTPTVERFTVHMERTPGGWRVWEILP